jgi:hypothetical protein
VAHNDGLNFLALPQCPGGFNAESHADVAFSLNCEVDKSRLCHAAPLTLPKRAARNMLAEGWLNA